MQSRIPIKSPESRLAMRTTMAGNKDNNNTSRTFICRSSARGWRGARMKYTHSLGISTSRFPVHFWFEEGRKLIVDGRKERREWHRMDGRWWCRSGCLRRQHPLPSDLLTPLALLLYLSTETHAPLGVDLVVCVCVCVYVCVCVRGLFFDSHACLLPCNFSLFFFMFSFSIFTFFPNHSLLTLFSLSLTIPLLYFLCWTVSADPLNKSSWVHVMHRQTRDRGTLNHYLRGQERL